MNKMQQKDEGLLVVDLVERDGSSIYHKVDPTVLITKRAGYQRKSYGRYRGYNDLTIAARLELSRSES